MYELYSNGFSQEEIQLILATINSDKIESLRHSAFKISPQDILDSTEMGISPRDYLKSQGKNLMDYKETLRDEQTVGVAFMYYSKRCILGDQTGLGKTIQLASLINILKKKNEMKRVLMIVESSSLGQMQFEMMSRTGLKFASSEGTASKLKKVLENTDWESTTGLIVPHSVLGSNVFFSWLAETTKNNKLEMFDMVALDESYVIKNINTKTYEYFKILCDRVDRAYLLNATVMEMDLKEVYNQIYAIRSDMLPSWKKIEEKYCVFGRGKPYYVTRNGQRKRVSHWEFKEYKNQSIFKEACKLVYIAREKEDKVKHNYRVEYINPTLEQWETMAGKVNKMSVLNCPIDFTDVPFTLEGVPKLKRLIELVQSDECKDKKIMVYCWNKKAQKRIQEELELIGKKAVIMNGSENRKADERYEIQESLNKGDTEILITNIRRALNLWGAKICIMYSLETNPGKMEQVRGRIDRNVDDEPRTFILLLYKDTVEESKLKDTIKQRSEGSRDFMADIKTAVDFFLESIE